MQILRSQYGQPDLQVAENIPTVMLRYYLGNVHVGTSYLDVAREVWDAMKRGSDSHAYTGNVRRQTLAAAVWLHRENRLEYVAVVNGRL